MGYTHYWKTKKVSVKKFGEFADACKKLHENLPKNSISAGGYHSDEPLVIKCGMGTGHPKMNSEMVWFNGDEKEGLDHETFCLEPQGDGDFCKTARKPYDMLVSASLLLAHFMLGYKISSDGDISDWYDLSLWFNEQMDDKYIVTPELLIELFGDYKNQFQTAHPELF